MTKTKVPSAIQLNTAELQQASGGLIAGLIPAVQKVDKSASGGAGGAGKVSFQDLHCTT